MYLPMATPPVKVTRSTSGFGQHLVGDLARVAGDDREHLGRQPRLVEDVGEEQRGERRLLGGLEHHPVVGRDRRRDLVRDLVQRMVERRDRGDRAQQRLAQRVDLALAAVRGDVAGEDLAVVGERRVAGKGEHVAGAADLVERVLLADPALGGDEVGDLVGAAADDLGRRDRGSDSGRAASAPGESRVRSRTRGEPRPRVAFGTVPTSAPVYGLWTSIVRSPPDAFAGDPHLLAQHVAVPHVLQLGHHVHGAAPAHARWLSARSKASKLRQRRPEGKAGAGRFAISGTCCSERPPCERSGASSPERS